MKMNLSSTIVYADALGAIEGRNFPVKISYAIMKNLKQLREEADRFEKLRISACEKYAEKDSEGNPAKKKGIRNGRAFEEYDIPEEEMENLKTEIEDLANTETDINIHMVPFSDFEKMESGKYEPITPAQLGAIDFMIEG